MNTVHTYTISTDIIHAKEGYIPDHPLIEVEPVARITNGYGYNEADLYEDDQSTYRVTMRGSVANLHDAWCAFADLLAKGCQGGDDDAFDYMPSCWDGLIALARQLDYIGRTCEHIGTCQRIWQSLKNRSDVSLDEYYEDYLIAPCPQLT